MIVKNRLFTVSLCSELMFSLSELNPSMESFSFLRRPFTTEVRVRSDELPGPQPGWERLEALDRSSASRRTLMSFAFFVASEMSLSIFDRSSLIALALWMVLSWSCEW